MKDINAIDYIEKNHICLDLKAKNKIEALKELTKLIEDELIDSEKFLDDLISREFASTTGLEKGLAIPHVRSSHVKNFTIGLAISKEGIDFDSIDDLPAKLLLVIATNDKYNDYYLQALSQLTSKLDKKSIDRIIYSESKEEILEILKNTEV